MNIRLVYPGQVTFCKALFSPVDAPPVIRILSLISMELKGGHTPKGSVVICMLFQAIWRWLSAFQGALDRGRRPDLLLRTGRRGRPRRLLGASLLGQENDLGVLQVKRGRRGRGSSPFRRFIIVRMANVRIGDGAEWRRSADT